MRDTGSHVELRRATVNRFGKKVKNPRLYASFIRLGPIRSSSNGQ